MLVENGIGFWDFLLEKKEKSHKEKRNCWVNTDGMEFHWQNYVSDNWSYDMLPNCPLFWEYFNNQKNCKA